LFFGLVSFLFMNFIFHTPEFSGTTCHLTKQQPSFQGLAIRQNPQTSCIFCRPSRLQQTPADVCFVVIFSVPFKLTL
jgi:hypothetical protein